MNKQLNTLDFSKILNRLAQYAMFSASKELALALRPTPYWTEARERQAETTEAFRLLSAKDNVSIGGARDVRPMVVRAQRGVVLGALEMLEIRQTLIAARDLQRVIVRLEQEYPRLADIAQRIEECPGVVNEIGRAIDERGEVKSSASPTLARIRSEQEIAHERLMEKLNRILASPQTNRYLQEPLITQREGRYVVPLKAEFKGKIQGIIHDQSASGATLFVEPMATVELNNRLRQLQLDEDEEIRRILTELSELISSHGRLINHSVDALADLDLAFAKAKYAEAIDAVEPILFDQEQGRAPGEGGTDQFKLLAARHPLLNPDTVVPINVFLPEDTCMLIITGPNTGGKTVSLKTVGLLAAMAQAGLRIPAEEGSVLPVFNHIFADIGDEQSIEQSLSTFSSHMTNIVQILAQCDRRSLIILDELGAGTDPTEGAALARSILAHLLEDQVMTFVATHYSELKAFAHTTPGVANASMEFDLATLQPTFHLRIGLPGASNAFAIARRLGLPEEIIDHAQGLIGENARQIEVMLEEIKAQTEAAHRLRRAAEAEREEAKKYKQQFEDRLKEVDAERRQILNSAREDARREIKAVREQIKALREQAEEAARSQAPVSAKAEAGQIDIQQVEEQLERLGQEVKTRVEKAPRLPEKNAAEQAAGMVQPGDKVFINQFNTVGEVVTVQNRQVEVQLGHFRATVPLSEIDLREKAAPRTTAGSTPRIRLPEAESPGMELDLRGQVANEALLNLDQYLDQAFMARLPWVRIIHGKGSGVLRQTVREALRENPLVSTYRPGDEGEGGEGVTVAKLALG